MVGENGAYWSWRDDDGANIVRTTARKVSEGMQDKGDPPFQGPDNVRGAITADIGDRVILDLVGLDADDGPVARRVRVVDVAPLDLVRTQRGPPDALCRTRKRKRDLFGDHWCARRGVVGERRNEFEEVLVCERRRAWERERAVDGGHTHEVREGLCNVHDLCRAISRHGGSGSLSRRTCTGRALV